ncbi:hypothetical protein PMI13_02414, partial [Chryseobacterium populi]
RLKQEVQAATTMLAAVDSGANETMRMNSLSISYSFFTYYFK